MIVHIRRHLLTIRNKANRLRHDVATRAERTIPQDEADRLLAEVALIEAAVARALAMSEPR